MLRGAHDAWTELLQPAGGCSGHQRRPCRMHNCCDPRHVSTPAALPGPGQHKVPAAPRCRGLGYCGPCRLPEGRSASGPRPCRAGPRPCLCTLWRLAPPSSPACIERSWIVATLDEFVGIDLARRLLEGGHRIRYAAAGRGCRRGLPGCWQRGAGTTQGRKKSRGSGLVTSSTIAQGEGAAGMRASAAWPKSPCNGTWRGPGPRRNSERGSPDAAAIQRGRNRRRRRRADTGRWHGGGRAGGGAVGALLCRRGCGRRSSSHALRCSGRGMIYTIGAAPAGVAANVDMLGRIAARMARGHCSDHWPAMWGLKAGRGGGGGECPSYR